MEQEVKIENGVYTPNALRQLADAVENNEVVLHPQLCSVCLNGFVYFDEDKEEFICNGCGVLFG